uniref:(northern house mosquito) hypothetical protein n=1 Tax=Culex pipiens TaxID=7175 RepID=A0A8D8BIQ4_CULPI
MLDFNNHAESATIDQIRRVEIRTSVRIDDEQLLQLTKVFPAMDSFLIGCITNCTAAGVEAAKKRLPKCSFQIYGHRAPVYSVLESWSDSESTELDTDLDSS